MFKSYFHFCPTGFESVRVGMIEVHMGRDPADPGKTMYPHYASVGVLEGLGIDPHKTWRSIDVFKRELRKAATKQFKAQLEAIEKER